MLAVQWPISFDRPQWLWLLLTIPVIVAVSLRLLRSIERPRRMAAIVLRCLVIGLIAAALARVEWVKRSENVAVMFVLDRSRSIPDELRTKTESYIREVTRHADRDDRMGVIGFDGEADVDVMPSRAGFDIVSFGLAREPDKTDIAAGIRMAMASFPPGYARRIVLLTDGNQNSGDLMQEVEAAAANQVAVDVVPLQYKYENEILFDRIVVPTQADRDSRVQVRMIARSQKPTRARLSLYHNGEEVPLANPDVSLSGGMRPDPFTFNVELRSGGVHRFDARVTPLAEHGDSIPENNQATGFTFVESKGKVLLVSRPGSDDDRVLTDALRREQIDLDHVTLDRIDIDLLKLQEYGAVILANIPADLLNSDQHKALASYVRDVGGGLVMTGGDEAFGAGGWIGSPVEEVSPVRFEIKHKKKMPRGALAIIMHSCEAPDGNYWGQQVAIASVQSISSLDYLGVIAYSWSKGGPNWEVPLAVARNKAAVIQKIKQMEIGDMPDFGSTMDIAVRDLMKLEDAAQRHMIIISDGDPSPPSPALIQKMVDNRITCSTVGIGYGEHVFADRMAPIAQGTGGNYYAIKNPRRLPQIFIKEARTVKRALIDDRNFQPVLTSSLDELTSGLAATGVPPLGGLVLTERKPDALVPMLRQGTEGGDLVEDPVLAYWNFEMGKMAVFTSGWWPKWGENWAGWGQFGKFWAQLVRWASRDTGPSSFDVVTRLDGNKGHIVVEALNKDASYLNFLRINGVLVTPSMDRSELHLVQTGPGRYEASFDVAEHGNYLVNLRHSDRDNRQGLIRSGLSVSYSAEFRDLNTNYALLNQVVARTSGRELAMDPLADKVFDKNLPPVVARRPMWRWVITWLLLPLFLLDVANRRLASTLAMSVYVEAAVFVVALAAFQPWGWGWAIVVAIVLAEAVGWLVRYQSIGPTIAFFTSGVRSLSRAGQRSAKSLAQLKDVRERVREDLKGEEPPSPPEPPRTTRLEPLRKKQARYDVGNAEGAKPAGDLSDALGGAKPQAGTQGEKPGRPKPAADQAGGDLASRLRRAKQRAKEEMDDRKDQEK